MNYSELFLAATGNDPYPYQIRLATDDEFPEFLNVPTGVGKTAAAILGWLYRRRSEKHRNQTPRRLVYCLPMRSLVEQTRDCAVRWLDRLGQFSGTVEYTDDAKLCVKSYTLDLDGDRSGVAVHILMGGADATPWDEHPERDAILIGTQDMLLSRALNRGYGMSRYRWPMHFGLLNNDCLWVMDETQLMGVGVTTSAQLQGLRTKLFTFGVTHSLWMSATLSTSPMNTVDHPVPDQGFRSQQLTSLDNRLPQVVQRIGARKPLENATLILNSESEKKGYAKEFAALILDSHRDGTLTMVVINRVSRAQDVFIELQKLAKKKEATVELVLIHSRFRPNDRARHERLLFSKQIPDAGRVVVATQAIEAGVDVSATTMLTELAPWPSLVQRFGRCNRYGEAGAARVIWIDVQPKDERDKVALPYDAGEFDKSRRHLTSLADAGPTSLESVKDDRPLTVVHTLRRKDLLDLFDTTPDLGGNDLDVSRFIREGDDTDVQVYWRRFSGEQPSTECPAPVRQELCPVAIGRIREFLLKHKKNKQFAQIWKPLEKDWRPIEPDEVRPGMVLLLKQEYGGYLDDIGWTGDANDKRMTVYSEQPVSEVNGTQNEAIEDDPRSLSSKWIALSDHLRDVTEAMTALGTDVNNWPTGIPWTPLLLAAAWHDVGKIHPAFQNMLLRGHADAELRRRTFWAKSVHAQNGRPRYFAMADEQDERTGFRHELASALVWLTLHNGEEHADLVAFLIAAHHGKVRGNIRSLSNETTPDNPDTLFARGLRSGDRLPELNLGNGNGVPPMTLELELMKLGEGDLGASWLSRVLALRDQYGPFKLSFLESLLRIADWRGSRNGEQRNDD